MSDQTSADPRTDHVASGDLSTVDVRAMFRGDASARERMTALTNFATTLHGRLRDVASAAGDSADIVAERSGRLLSEMVDRLPIRTADELRGAYGPDPTTRAERVIDDAATLARWLWTAAHTVPAPSTVVHAAKAVVHAAIEIRMVGEIHEAHRDPDVSQGPTPLAAVLKAWLHGTSAGLDLSVASAAALVTRVRRMLTEFRGNDGRIRGLINRGKEGGELVRRLGGEMSRSLRQAAAPRGGRNSGTMASSRDARWDDAAMRDADGAARTERAVGPTDVARAEQVIDRFAQVIGDSDAMYRAFADISRAGGAGPWKETVRRGFNDPGILDRPWWWLAVAAERANGAGQSHVAAKIAAFTEMFVVLFLPKLNLAGAMDAGLSDPPAAARARIGAAGLAALATIQPGVPLLGQRGGYRRNDGTSMELTAGAIEWQIASAVVELDRTGTAVRADVLQRARAVLAGNGPTRR